VAPAPGSASSPSNGAGLAAPDIFIGASNGTSGGTSRGALNGESNGASPPQAVVGRVSAAILEAAPEHTPVLEVSPVPLVSAPLTERERRRRWPWLVLVVIVVLAAAGLQASRPLPALGLHRALPPSPKVPGAAPVLPWPATGEAAIAIPELGVSVESGPEAGVPIASLTKIMTAYLILRDHPIAPDAQGPMLTLTAADQAEAAAEAAAGATNVPVQVGERLSERQLLDGLVVHSANNLSDVLARWDAGTVPAFVTKMNVTATSLGMVHTHYADASGLDPGTAATAGDMLRIMARAMAIPAFATVANQRSVTLPVAGPLSNFVQAVGTDGIVGGKSGFTQAALGCLVLAGERTVAGRTVLILAAVTGQPGKDPLRVASQVDVQLIDAVAAAVVQVPVMASGARVASVRLPWSDTSVPVVAGQGARLLAWPGQVPQLALTGTSLHPGMRTGARVGTVTVSLGQEHVAVPARADGTLGGPSMGWRLTH
jgi:D-alanyl-D-alanine carboxypeptidase (penicillin-binding protein 5/6)